MKILLKDMTMDILNLMSSQVEESYPIDFNLQQYWKDFVSTGILKDNIHVVDLDSKELNPYMYNFYGLLHNLLNIPRDYWLPNLFVNGYDSPLDYRGETQIKIINPDILEDALNNYMTLAKLREKNKQ